MKKHEKILVVMLKKIHSVEQDVYNIKLTKEQRDCAWRSMEDLDDILDKLGYFYYSYGGSNDIRDYRTEEVIVKL